MFRTLYGYREAFADNRAVLEHPEVNTVFVCVPTHLHAEIVHAAGVSRPAPLLREATRHVVD